jgi:hypothetical protein
MIGSDFGPIAIKRNTVFLLDQYGRLDCCAVYIKIICKNFGSFLFSLGKKPQ